MKITVVIPCFNEEKHIGSVLDSVFGQKIMPDEIIVVDNNCTDRTVEIAQKFNVRIIKEKRQGLSFAEHRGYDDATCEIIGRIDADTILSSDWVERVKRNFEVDDVVVGVSGPVTWREIAAPTAVNAFHKLSFFTLGKLLTGTNILFGSNYAIRKSVWSKIRDKVNENDSLIHEDMELTFKIAKYGRIMYDPGLNVSVSARRFKSLKTYWNYPYRYMATIFSNRALFSYYAHNS